MPPWPDANGNGNYLELTNHTSDNNNPVNWISANNLVVSVESPKNGSLLKMYPNPVRSNLHIQSDKSVLLLQISDIQGNIISEIKPDNNDFYIDMNSFKTGLYIVKAYTYEGFFVRKIVKD